MKKVYLVILLLLVSFVPVKVRAAELRVPQTYTSIQAAITAAQTNDVILISPGTYTGALTLNKGVVLKATTYDQANPKNNTVIINGNGAAIGVSIPSGVTTPPQMIGVAIKNAESPILANSPFLLEYSYVTDGGDLIEFEEGSGGTVRNNVLEAAGDDAIDLDNQIRDLLIENNIIRANRQDGIEIRIMDNTLPTPITVTIRNNRIEGNGAGSGGDGIQFIDYDADTNRYYHIQGNLFLNNKQAGIGLMCCTDTDEDFQAASIREEIRVINNTFVGNNHGISGGDNMLVANNIFKQNTLAIKNVDNKSYVTNNLFFGNTTNTVASNVNAAQVVTTDPLLSANYELTAGSPAIDRGTASYSWVGLFRTFVLNIAAGSFTGTAPDLGWKEFTNGQTLPTSTPTPTPVPGQATATPVPNPTTPPPTGKLVAFAGAEGFGADTVGGRGGKVMEVTTLANSGPGSLRECVESSGPRVCVFRVAGTIELTSRLNITNPFITIAGQTAPGQGITLKAGPGLANGMVTIPAGSHDIIIRYIRSRPGPPRSSSGSLISGETLYAFEVNGYNIIFDHVSTSWSGEETFTTWGGVRNMTVQWSILAEGLRNSTHPEGDHSKGMLLGSTDAHSFSVHHNLIANSDDRFPEIKLRTGGVGDVVNNVMYNWGPASNGITSRITLVSDSYGKMNLNLIGNYYKPGPDSNTSLYELFYFDSTGQGASLFVKDNIGHHRANNTIAQDAIVDPGAKKYLVTTAHPSASITTTTPEVALQQVLTQAGASKMLNAEGDLENRRDTADTRIVSGVQNNTGKIINDPAEVGGWPTLSTGTPYADTDKDGMGDKWETVNFGDTSRGSSTDSSGDFDKDGYSDLEEFLNSTNPKVSNVGGGCLKSQGDANCDSKINLVDFETWRREFSGLATTKTADFNANGSVDLVDYETWRRTFTGA